MHCKGGREVTSRQLEQHTLWFTPKSDARLAQSAVWEQKQCRRHDSCVGIVSDLRDGRGVFGQNGCFKEVKRRSLL